jgi:inorganic phosphate transporter, PiT family
VEVAVVVAVVVFCVVTGANDGAALASMSARVAPGSLGIALLVLAAVVAVTPLVTVRVAETLSRRLVGFEAGAGQLIMLVAVTVAVAVVAILAARGQPTSLTLALVGALGGAGLGAGLPVAWPWVAGVLLAAAVAPVAAAALASALSWAGALMPAHGPLGSRVVAVHRVGFGLQAVAYASNDGQKMLAVAAIAMPGVLPLDGPNPLGLVGIGLLFLVGSVAGLRRVGRTLADAVLPVRPPAAVSAELASAAAVLISSALAAPVSMTQAISGGLLGSSVRTGYRRVRWGVALRLVRAWVVTLPAAFIAAGVVAAAAERVMA